MSIKWTYRSFLKTFFLWVMIPLCIGLGIVLFKNRNYRIISLLMASFSCIPFFLKYERKKPQARELVFVSILCACSVVSRVIFYPLPGFKPIAALTIICGLAFGKEAGFMNGALSALISNLFFGQGPWMPFQMISWGIIGYLAGVLQDHKLFEHKIFLYLYGIFAAVLFSLIMDIYSSMAVDNVFNLSRYIAVSISSLPSIVVYMVANVVFLWLLVKPMMKKLNRIKMKYGIIDEA
ncbi:MAG: ECF transporter S component [Erysipelotrichaceae bacterium]